MIRGADLVLVALWCFTFAVLRWNAERARARRVQVIRAHAGLARQERSAS